MSQVRIASSDGTFGFEIPVVMEGGSESTVFSARIPAKRLGVGSHCTYDFWLLAAGARAKRRVTVEESVIAEATGSGLGGRGRLRSTAGGNLILTLDQSV
ncbi:hypothetical protein [Brevibacterium jeotgali]|uniref:Uncharacterized protein n=1 Tax=Brevibacterium jeotgali TaxID=1262550 RepID=A0A2H1L8V2_9MICO|nr:hypothetical protein [Brevibacterium jeotgali]TWB98822.1 hypothetical protein FB108_2720 [Brevibacterium jeotgali]SMY13180.1 hypothetical protein BJEO58_02790 [Brevibacterium jeotgali]